MLKKQMIQEIRDLKLMGYSIGEIIEYYESNKGKAPSRPTIRKYYGMDVMPDNLGEKLAKDKAFDKEPFKSAILGIMNNNPKGCPVSSVYDVLEEIFIESGKFKKLPGNDQTLRNYIRYLKESGAITEYAKGARTYEHVFDTPPGEQMLIDFGQQQVANGVVIHFICLLLRYSRMLCVSSQDHRYNSDEACRDIYRAFVKLGGRPRKLVIDQDAVFVASETYGEVVETRVFGDFLKEQGLTLFVCRKADPESKGPIENSVGFVKKNFFGARKILCIEDVWRSLPGWLERKSRRIHQATYCVPRDVWISVEKKALLPAIPSYYENAPSTFTPVTVGSVPYISCKASKYSVPREYCFKKVFVKTTSDKLHIYDSEMIHICSHELNDCKGSWNRLPDHKKEPSEDWKPICERLRAKWNCYEFQHLINGFKKENPRYLSEQLRAVEKFLDEENPKREFVTETIAICCRDWRYRYTQFRAVYELVSSGHKDPATVRISDVQKQELGFYQKAFENRCESERGDRQ
jgi:hypothetical protein